MATNQTATASGGATSCGWASSAARAEPGELSAGWPRPAQVRRPGKATSAIFVNLGGGPSHMDTFDLKPNAPKEFRGEFNPIATNVSGRRDLRAPAQARAVRRQVRDPPRRQPQPGRPRVRHQVHEHGQPAAPVAGVPRLWLGGDQGEARPSRPAAVRRDSRHAPGRRASSASNSRRSARRARPRQRPAVHRPGDHARGRPDGRGDREAAAAARRPRRHLPGLREDQRRRQRPRQVLPARLRHHQLPALAQGVRREQGIQGDHLALQRSARSARAACWRRGWSSRACGS